MKKSPLWIRLGCMVALCFVVALSMTQSAKAAPTAPGYIVRAVLPENQLEPLSYFSLLTPPGHSQTLEVEVENHLSEPLTVHVAITDAQTTSGGVIVYDATPDAQAGPAQGLSTLLELDAENIQTGPDQPILSMEGNVLTLAPYAAARIPFRLRVPQEALEGQLLGGIVLTKQTDPAAPVQTSFAVQSVYSYAIAVQLQNKTETDIQADFTLQGAALGEQAGYPVLEVSVQNGAPLVVTGAQLRLRILPRGDGEPLLDKENGHVSMAPHSRMSYTISLGADEPLPPGEYDVLVDLTYQGHTTTMQTSLLVEDVSP